MSEVKNNRTDLLDLPGLYARTRMGTGCPDGQARIGVEIERWFLNTDDLSMMRPEQSQQLLQKLAQTDPQSERWYERNGQRQAQPGVNTPLVCVSANGLSYQLELCGVLEAATSPVLAQKPEELFRQIRTASNDMRRLAGTLGLGEYCAALPGSVQIPDCERNMVARERLQAEWAKFKLGGPASPGLRTMGLATSAQLSVNYAGPEAAYEIMALGTLLAPVLYAACANTTGFVEGAMTVEAIPRANWWLQHNLTAPRGGFPKSVFEGIFAQDREGLTDRWIDYVRNVPMVYYYDENKTAQFSSSPSFNELAARGNGTAANYALAESLVWPDVKLIGGQRIELRMPDSGWWQPAALGILGAGVLSNPQARADLLRDLKKSSQLTADDLLLSRLQVGVLGSAAPYGRGQIQDMFKVLAAYLPEDLLAMSGRAGERFRRILDTGQTDRDLWRARLKGVRDARIADRIVLET